MIHLFFRNQLTNFCGIKSHCHFLNMDSSLFCPKSILFTLQHFHAWICQCNYIFCFWMNFQCYLVQIFFFLFPDYYTFLWCHFRYLYVCIIFTLMSFHFGLNYAYIIWESLISDYKQFEHFQGLKSEDINYFLLFCPIQLQCIIHCSG